MREWGLFVSRGRSDDEPARFNEPGLFLIEPDGTVYYESILSMPAGRRDSTTCSLASTTGRRSVIPLAARPDRLGCDGRLDSERAALHSSASPTAPLSGWCSC